MTFVKCSPTRRCWRTIRSCRWPDDALPRRSAHQSSLLAEWLREAGHEAFHVRERGLSRASDEEIFAIASAENAVIVTADLDFSRIVALSGRAQPGLILFRAGGLSDEQMLGLLQTVIDTVSAEQLQRSVVVADRTSLRVASLPLRPDLGD